MIACDTSSEAPTLCMNDFSSASPKVIAPRQISETRAPDFPSGRYFMRRLLRGAVRDQLWRLRTRQALVPPKPKLLVITCSTRTSRAVFGT